MNKAVIRRFVEEYQSGHDVAVAEELLADGDKVITRKTFHGTRANDFMGIPATGNAVRFDVIDILTVRDGRMREHWNVVDGLALMIGVGAVPPMG